MFELDIKPSDVLGLELMLRRRYADLVFEVEYSPESPPNLVEILENYDRDDALEQLLEIFNNNNIVEVFPAIIDVSPQRILELEAVPTKDKEAQQHSLLQRETLTAVWQILLRDEPWLVEELFYVFNDIDGAVDEAFPILVESETAVNFGDDEVALDGTGAFRLGYLQAAPLGIDALSVWKSWDYAGENAKVRVIDLERGWGENEDFILANHPLISGDVFDKSIPHGTAVLGILGAIDNDKGIIGILNRAKPNTIRRISHHYDSEIGVYKRVANAIEKSLADGHLIAGDILLLEVQAGSSRPYPISLNRSVQLAMKTASNNGIVIIEPAGNGFRDLNISSRWSGSQNETGSIMVGACSAPVINNRHLRWPTSNYGARVNCFAWGERVITTGNYPKVFSNMQIDDYTEIFNGTSAASAIIAGAAALIQGIYNKSQGGFLNWIDMRFWLTYSGTDYEGGEHIGVMPDLKSILEWMEHFQVISH